MDRLPLWAFFVFGVVAILLGLSGIINASHAIAKVMWVVITILGVASIVVGFRKRAAAGS